MFNYQTRTFITACVLGACCCSAASAQDTRPNIVLVLCDDHRWDALSMMGHPFLQTPHLDRMAREGAHFANAFVTTSLCSPSRASILTGLFAHNHGVVDNYHEVDDSLTFFPQRLQDAGYETAFVGKWHMGDLDEPQRGFDHWVAFRGQGTYYPDGHGTTRVVPQTRYDGFNVNGQRVPQEGYITDELTDYAIRFLDAFANIDVRHRLKEVKCPTLVIHCRGDMRIPLTSGRKIAAQIPGAEFTGLDSNSHLLLGREPASADFIAAVRRFLSS